MSTKAQTTLRTAREALGITIRELRDASGISTGRLSMLERGMVKPNASECLRLASAVNCTIEDLFPEMPFLAHGPEASNTPAPRRAALAVG